MGALVVWKAGASSLRLSRRVGMDLHGIVHWQPIDGSRAGCLLPPLKLPQRKSIAASYRFCWVAEVWSKGNPSLSAFCFGKDLQNIEKRKLSIHRFFSLTNNLSQCRFIVDLEVSEREAVPGVARIAETKPKVPCRVR